MVESIQNFGDIKHPNPKRESDFPNPGKNFPGFFCALNICKIVTNVTKIFDYIDWMG